MARHHVHRKRTSGKLQLVDLAGSERISKMEDSNPDRLKESTFINKSLSALGDVLFALGKKSSHVPFRNSKLTHVLQVRTEEGAVPRMATPRLRQGVCSNTAMLLPTHRTAFARGPKS